MNDIHENPQLSVEELQFIEKKITSNRATSEDFEKLEFFLSSIGIPKGYLLSKFNEHNIGTFDEFIFERTLPFDQRKRSVDGILLGYIIGSITFLKEYLNKNKVSK